MSHYPTVSIGAKISVFPRLQANMYTLTTAKFGNVRKPWTTFNVKYILDPYPLDKVIRPLNNWGQVSSVEMPRLPWRTFRWFAIQNVNLVLCDKIE